MRVPSTTNTLSRTDSKSKTPSISEITHSKASSEKTSRFSSLSFLSGKSAKSINKIPEISIQQPSRENLVPSSPLVHHHVDITSTFPVTLHTLDGGSLMLLSVGKTSFRDHLRCQFKYESQVPLKPFAIRLICEIDKTPFQQPIDFFSMEQPDSLDLSRNATLTENVPQAKLITSSHDPRIAIGECVFSIEESFIPCLYDALHVLGIDLSTDDFEIDGTLSMGFELFHFNEPSLGQSAPKRKGSIVGVQNQMPHDTATPNQINLNKLTASAIATFNVDFSVLKTSRADGSFLQPRASRRKKKAKNTTWDEFAAALRFTEDEKNDMNEGDFLTMF